MKLVSRLEFLKMPIGTIYSRCNLEYGSCCDQFWKIQKLIKVHLLDEDCKKYIPLTELNETSVDRTDFWYETIFPPSINIHDIRSNMSEFERTMTSFYTTVWEDTGFEQNVEYDIVDPTGDSERDGEYTQDEQFLIWSKEDLDTFVSSLSPHCRHMTI